MDKTSLVMVGLQFSAVASIVFTACTPAPVSKNTAVVSTPVPPTFAAKPVEVSTPINVTFSTYSKDWPVEWEWIDPDERREPTPHDVKKGVLRMSVPSKKDLQGANRSAPRYVKAVKGDFQIETRVKVNAKENYQGAGLLIYRDDDHYIRFERAYGGPDGGGEGLRLDVREAGEQRSIVTTRDVQTEAAEVDLRIVRSGGLFTAYWREGDDGEWREAGECEADYPGSVLIGVVAVNTARPLTAEFSYIRLLPGIKR